MCGPAPVAEPKATHADVGRRKSKRLGDDHLEQMAIKQMGDGVYCHWGATPWTRGHPLLRHR